MKLIDKEVVRVIYRSEKPLSQEAIADKIGCSGRTVNRSIKRLKAVGYISVLCAGLPYGYQVKLEELPDEIRVELER